jgi:hypothetical protein
MQNRNVGLAVAAVAVIAAVALFLVLREDDENGTETTQTTAQTTTQATTTTDEQTTTKEQTTTTEKPEVATIVVKDGEPVGGVQDLSFPEGEQMRFTVEANIEDEVHLHGYDVEEEVAPGQPARFDLQASIPGVFELELHHAVTQIAEITVE